MKMQTKKLALTLILTSLLLIWISRAHAAISFQSGGWNCCGGSYETDARIVGGINPNLGDQYAVRELIFNNATLLCDNSNQILSGNAALAPISFTNGLTADEFHNGKLLLNNLLPLNRDEFTRPGESCDSSTTPDPAVCAQDAFNAFWSLTSADCGETNGNGRANNRNPYQVNIKDVTFNGTIYQQCNDTNGNNMIEFETECTEGDTLNLRCISIASDDAYMTGSTVSYICQDAAATIWAFDDAYSTKKKLSVSDPGALANDINLSGLPLQMNVTVPPQQGTLVQPTLDGGFKYTPAPGFVGIDGFLYKATDGTHQSNEAEVEIEVK